MAKATKKSAAAVSTKSSATSTAKKQPAMTAMERFESSLSKVKSTGDAKADQIAQAIVRKVFTREMKVEGSAETGFTGKIGKAKVSLSTKKVGKSNRYVIQVGNVEIGGAYAAKAYTYATTAVKPAAGPKVSFKQEDLDSVLDILG